MRVQKRKLKVRGYIFCPDYQSALKKRKEQVQKGFKCRIKKWKAGYRVYFS